MICAGGTPAAEDTGLTRVVYISPLKALAYDIERNLRAPLRGIGATDVRVGIRTGDTPQRERAAHFEEGDELAGDYCVVPLAKCESDGRCDEPTWGTRRCVAGRNKAWRSFR